MKKRVAIRRLNTGVPGLDEVLGDGLPEYSLNLITGEPGTGKTTLATQIATTNASREHPALMFTVYGEPSLKILRHLQGYGFFKPEWIGREFRLVDLSDEVLQGRGDFTVTLDRLTREIETIKPRVVVIDSFRPLLYRLPILSAEAAEGMDVDRFMQLLALRLHTWEVTSLLVGDYPTSDPENPVSTIVDGIIRLAQTVQRRSCVRTLQVIKQRAASPAPGLHSMRITEAGVAVFPRVPATTPIEREPNACRVSTGIPDVDDMMGGGIPQGDAALIAGPSGAGKTTFGIHFLAAAAERQEPAVLVMFEEDPADLITRARMLGKDLAGLEREGKLLLRYNRPLDLSVDEVLQEIRSAVRAIGARRVMIDSLSGMAMALAPSFRDDLNESVYRLVRAVTAEGVTLLMTTEASGTTAALSPMAQHLSVLADDIVVLQFAEVEGELVNVLSVVKMRRSRHSSALRQYKISPSGIELGRSLREFDHVLLRSPQHRVGPVAALPPGLHEGEMQVLEMLVRIGPASLERLAREGMAAAKDIEGALRRLVTLAYAEELRGHTPVTYRAIAQGTRK